MRHSWIRLGHWADKRLPGLLLLAFVLLMSQLDSARATDIEVAPVVVPVAADEGLSLAALGFDCASSLSALAVLLYGLFQTRQSASRPDRPVNLPAADRQDSSTQRSTEP